MSKIVINSLDFYRSTIVVPVNGWEKPVYMDYNGALRAFKFIKVHCQVSNVKNGYDAVKIPKNVYTIQVAGIGTLIVNADTENEFPYRYYETVEKYMNKDFDVQINKFIPNDWLKQCYLNQGCDTGDIFTSFRKSFPSGDGLAWSAVRYKWDGVKPVEVPVECTNEIYYDGQKGFHFNEPVKLPNNTYGTIELCKEHNTVKVIDFDSVDENNDVLTEYTVNLSRTLKVMAKFPSEAIEMAKQNIQDNPFGDEEVQLLIASS